MPDPNERLIEELRGLKVFGTSTEENKHIRKCIAAALAEIDELRERQEAFAKSERMIELRRRV